MTTNLSLNQHADQPVGHPNELNHLETQAEAEQLLPTRRSAYGDKISQILRGIAQRRQISWQRLAMQIGPNHLFNILVIKNKLGPMQIAADTTWWKGVFQTLGPECTGLEMANLAQAVLDLRLATTKT